MKQIIEPIAVSSYVQSEYAAVLNRLQSMGFTHSSGYSIGFMMESWEDYPVFDISQIRSQTFSRNASSDHFTSIIPAAQFLKEYGPEVPAPSVAAPTEPLNPPNFYIDTHDIPTLRKIAQELAFEAGIAWNFSRKQIASYNFRFLLVVRQADNDESRLWEKNHLYHGPPHKDIPVYSAATQMGEIVRLFSTPFTPPVPPPPTPPEIHGYKAVYSAGAPTVDFGCAKLGKILLQDMAKLMGCVINGDGSVMRDAGIVPEQGCNRSVESITLSSRKTLSRVQIKEILGYVAAVEEYAKKYPQKS